MITTTELADRVARATVSGGATMALDGTVPATGYVVALAGLERRYADGYADTLPARIGAYVDAHRAELEAPGRYLGTWVDPTDGALYVDTVELFDDRDAAELAGLAAGQLAIFDLTAGEEIRLEGTQVTP